MASKRLEKFLLKWDTRKKQSWFIFRWSRKLERILCKRKRVRLFFSLLCSFAISPVHPRSFESCLLLASFRFVLCLIHQERCRRSRQKSKLKKFNLLQSFVKVRAKLNSTLEFGSQSRSGGGTDNLSIHFMLLLMLNPKVDGCSNWLT